MFAKEFARCVRLWPAMAFGCFLFVTGGTLFGQNTGSIDGRLVDSSQSAAPGAAVVLTNTATNQARTSKTAEDG
jgi:hypothetical protein